jgi:DNA-binding MarR family transcriptional regulator
MSSNNAFEMASRFLRAWQTLNKKLGSGSMNSVLEQLNISQIRILQAVQDQPGINAQDIIEHLEIAPGTAKDLIMSMQKVGLVMLERDPDQKLPNVRLGAQGQRVTYQIQATQLVIASELLANLSRDEQLCAVEALEQVAGQDFE